MTTIGAVSTKEGFVLGADGRMRLHDDSRANASAEALARETDYAQKIFTIDGHGNTVAFAMAGSVANDEVSCNLIKEAQRLALVSSEKQFRDDRKLVNGFCSALVKCINTARHLPKLHEGQYGWTIIDLIIVGYVNGCPLFSSVNFYHNGSFAAFRPMDWSKGSRLLYGSDVVSAKMYDPNTWAPFPDSPFAQYTKVMKEWTLSEAAEFVTGYVEACKSPLALQMDEQRCKFTGGHVHIAEVTPAGFRWRIPPKEKGESVTT